MNAQTFLSGALICMALAQSTARAEQVLQESSGLPISTFNITFRAGSADDPAGFEGLAFLAGRLLREGGVKAWKGLPARSRAELEDYLYPLAADIGVSVEKEQTSFQVTATSADATRVFKALSQMILAPRFDASEFERLKAESLDALQKQLPREDEEELGKAALDQFIYGKDHPYGHVVRGTVTGVRAITLKNVQDFYRTHFTRARVTVGAAGVISKSIRSAAALLVKSLPKGKSDRAAIPEAPLRKGRSLLIVKGPFDATGVHLGIPVPFTRASPDFAPMYLASTAFGKHRSFVGRLMHVVREVRGLNYGDYSYVEDFPHGGDLMTEPTQVARTRQAFTVWARPTPVENGCFLLRQIVREVQNLWAQGLTQTEFELGKSHLVGNIPLLGASLERSLGYAIDSRFYGLRGNYLMDLTKQIGKTTFQQTEQALKRYVDAADLRMVAVTADPKKLKAELLGKKCGIHYAQGIEKPKEVLEEDKLIASFPLGLDAEHITIVDSDSIFK